MTLFSGTMNKRILYPVCILAACLAVASCSHTGGKAKYYRLKSISDTALRDKGEATAYVQLRKGGPNVVTILNMESPCQLVRLYKQEGGHGDFKPEGELNPGLPKDAVTQGRENIRRRLVSFKDPGHSSMDDRYRIVPVVDGTEQPPLKMVYDTDDPDYFQRVEDKGPGK